MSLWNELRRRNVFKVGAAYLVIAWLSIQVTSTVAPALHLPDWTISFVVLMLILGLPVALVLAWAYELTPEGIRRTATLPDDASIAHVTGRRLNVIVMALLAVAVVYLLVDGRRTSDPGTRIDASAESTRDAVADTAPTPAQARIAILPFENLSPDPNNAFFADGLHEEVLSTLAARAPGLEVINWMTMQLYRGAPKPIREIAAELGATHVLVASVSRDGDTVRLRVQLVDARTEAQVWTEVYTRTLTNALTLQTEVAGRVAEQLSLRFIGEDRGAAPITSDPVAYDLYLRAKLARRNFNGAVRIDAWREVESLLNRAIDRDPAFLAAYLERIIVSLSMLADGYVVDESLLDRVRSDLGTMNGIAPTDPLTLFGEALNENYEQNFALSLDLMDEAQAAGYSDVDLLLLRAGALGSLGRFDELDAVKEQIIAVDPGNAGVLSALFFMMTWVDRPEEVMRLLAIGAAHQPQSPLWRVLGGQTTFDFTGDIGLLEPWITPVTAEQAELDIDIDDQLRITFERLLLQDRFREARDMLDQVAGDTMRIVVMWYFSGKGTGRIPTAELRGWASLLLDDREAAAQDGDAVLDFVAAAPTTRWNPWFLKALSADGELFRGRREQAIAAAREVLAEAETFPATRQVALARTMAARVLAWAGEHADAVDLLEELAVTPPIMPPAEIVRSPYFTVPLRDDPGFQALAARLDAKMAATRLD